MDRDECGRLVLAINNASFVPTATDEKRTCDSTARGEGGMTGSIEMKYSPFNVMETVDARRGAD